jgi:ribokinase
MIAAVGDDEFGRPLVQNLRAYGVDTSHVRVDRNAGSGMSVAIVDASRDYGAVIVSGVNLLLGEAEVDAADQLFHDAGWLVLQHEVPDAANLAAIAEARRHGVKAILNAAPARPMLARPERLVDVLVVNEIEAEAIAGIAIDTLAAATAAANRLLDLADAAIVTAGAAGASLSSRAGGTAEIAGHPVRLVSTHGAGDCFVGTLAARLSGGEPLEQAARYANAAAALRVATPPGAARSHDPSAIRDLLQAG